MPKITHTDIEIQTPFLRIAGKKWGTADGLPVIGLHGWLDNANTFDGIAPLLPELQLVSMDLPGHGRSQHRPPGMRYHYTDYVDDVIAVADALQWKRFTLLGHSMGTGIATFVAGAFPERVERLVLIEGLGAKADDLALAPWAMRESVMKIKNPGKTGRPRSIQALIRARSQAGRIDRRSAEILVRRSAIENDLGAVWQSDPRLSTPAPHPVSEDFVRPFLQRLQMPVLLIIAETGLLKERPYFLDRLKLVQNLQAVWLPGNHHLHLDTPKPVARIIADFIAANR